MIEPYLSEQWFVKMMPLAKPALEVVKKGRVRLHPHDRWYKTYEHWMENLRDWCISRQLWWGHRIPVYYCENCQEMMVRRETPAACPKCHDRRIRQDESVLDTWFSSWLWPFSTLGWPDQNDDLRYFYPTDLLVTAPDIIFFWVARMIMAGLEFVGEIPFHDVLFNGIVRDEFGRKMSKSLGNGIDPLEMIDQYSADAVRFTLIMLSSEGQDINLAVNHFEMGRNFSNKIWNAYRFLAMNPEPVDTRFEQHCDHFELADRWIISSFQKMVSKVTTALENFRVNESLDTLYHFFWHEYCDWYLELIKPRLYQKENMVQRLTALSIARHIMKQTMSLLHPYMPFISEEIWQSFKEGTDESVVLSPWPDPQPGFQDENSEKEMLFLQNAIGTIRNIRAEMNVPPGKTAPLIVRADPKVLELIRHNSGSWLNLAKIDSIREYTTQSVQGAVVTAVIEGAELFLPLADLIDLDKERQRLSKELQRLEGLQKSMSNKLSNEKFLNNAPPEIIKNEQEKLVNIEMNLKKIRDNYNNISGK
jgi:valyl-tRNA synthetase